MSAELERGRQRSTEVNAQLGQVLDQLRTARLDRQDSRRQVQRREQLEKLRRLYPKDVVRTNTGTVTTCTALTSQSI